MSWQLYKQILYAAIAIIAIGFLAISCGEENGDTDPNSGEQPKDKTPFELLPRDNDISGWMREGMPIEATNYNELYDVINGGAQKYIDNGFVSAAFQDYKNTAGLSLQLAIYEHANEANVDALYEDLMPPATQPLIIEGIAKGRIDESALMAYTIEFQKGKFFVQIIINEKSEDALGIGKLFAQHIANEIP